jgi:hypothetical protein
MLNGAKISPQRNAKMRTNLIELNEIFISQAEDHSIRLCQQNVSETLFQAKEINRTSIKSAYL